MVCVRKNKRFYKGLSDSRWVAATHRQQLALSALSIALVPTAVVGCAGTSPLMHTAHTLPAQKTRFAAGVAANFSHGEAATAIANARETATQSAGAPSEMIAQGAISAINVAPGLSPLISARIGLGYNAEAGITYSGRMFRLDGRWAYQKPEFALSFGAGFNSIAARRDGIGSADIQNLDLHELRGFGFDIPVIAGWKSNAELVSVWGGARAGIDFFSGDILYRPRPETVFSDNVNANRKFGGAVAGASVGFRHLHAAVEWQGGYQHVSGNLWNFNVALNGFHLALSSALWVTF